VNSRDYTKLFAGNNYEAMSFQNTSARFNAMRGEKKASEFLASFEIKQNGKKNHQN
jgi:hypothetical protein